jgi:hypothetical protein
MPIPFGRRIRTPIIILSAIAAAIMLGAAIYGWNPRQNTLLSAQGEKRVDKLLRKKLPDGQYQVIRWWPAIESAAVRDAEIALWESEVASSAARVDQAFGPDAKNAALSRSMHDEARLRGLRESASVRICRLKFRYKNALGKVVDQDDVYLLTDRQAVNLDPNWPAEQRIEAMARAEFPD